VGESQQGGRQAGIKGHDALPGVHFPERVEGARIVPWRTVGLEGAGADLRHKASLDDPDGVCDKRRAATGGDGSQGTRQPYVVYRGHR